MSKRKGKKKTKMCMFFFSWRCINHGNNKRSPGIVVVTHKTLKRSSTFILSRGGDGAQFKSQKKEEETNFFSLSKKKKYFLAHTTTKIQK